MERGWRDEISCNRYRRFFHKICADGRSILCDDDGSAPHPKEGRDELVEALGKLYDRFAGEIDGMAIAAPGIIDSRKGYFYTGGALRYNEALP